MKKSCRCKLELRVGTGTSAHVKSITKCIVAPSKPNPGFVSLLPSIRPIELSWVATDSLGSGGRRFLSDLVSACVSHCHHKSHSLVSVCVSHIL